MGSLATTLFHWRRALVGAVVVVALAWAARAPAARLRARLPDPLNANHKVIVLTDVRPPPRPGAPLVRVHPRLALCGVVEGVADDVRVPAAGDTALRVSIFPESRSVLRDDAELSVRVTTPDLLEIVSAHLTPARRDAMASALAGWHHDHERAIALAGERAREIATRELGMDELGQRLWQDPALSAALAGALEREVTSRVDWQRVWERALGSEAAEVAGELAGEAGVFSPVWAGVREGYAARFRGLFRDEPPRRPEDDFDGYLSPLNLFVPRWSESRRAALARAGERVQERFPEYRPELERTGRELAADLAREEALDQKGLQALGAFARDPGLREAILERHGPEAWRRIERLSVALAEDEELRWRLRGALDKGLELLAGFLRELALDAEGEGPNPLLVAFVRARLLGKAEPVLVIDDPGAGEPARSGHVFASRSR